MSVIEDIRRAEAAKRQALASLHVELGFSSAQALASAILEAAGRSGSSPTRSSSPPQKRAKGAGKGRAIPAEKRQAIVEALQSGVNGTEVTRRFAVSYPTVHSIKQQLGMVRPRPGTGPNRGKKRPRRKKTAKK